MTFALCLQLPNHIKFKSPIDIYGNFIPQIIFLESIFGYLAVCIIYKWSVDWSKSSTSPPSLLNMLIAMVLSPGNVPEDQRLYPGQPFVQTVLLGLAGICIPWMLCVKPYHEWKEMHKTTRQGYVGLGEETSRDTDDSQLEGEEEGNGRAFVEDGEEDGVCIFLSSPGSG